MAFNTFRASILWEHLGEPFHFRAQVFAVCWSQNNPTRTFEV